MDASGEAVIANELIGFQQLLESKTRFSFGESSDSSNF
jgi:hypothetical protein